MEPDPWQRLQVLFASAQGLLGPEREAFLDRVESEDPDLAPQLRAMCAAVEDSRLEDPTHRPATLPVSPRIGAELGRIGPYRLQEVIGEGGMGVVYRAEQSEPLRRRVAVKIVKPGHDNANVLARFDSERQALAIMDHEAIAKVLDAGTTPDGRPYFAMEYVAGLPITEYCDREKLSTDQRLALFAEVCDGVQHAHQKGVIHRDLKPSNILVSTDGDRHRPKIIDFGIAKATGFQLTEKTLYTQRGQLVGTPEYMSPEQADPTALDIDTRTDVYSLGVLLYVLLVGRHPYRDQLTRSRDLLEVRRIILEQDAPRPSTLIRSGDATETLVQARRTEVGTLRRQLRGELDWIALKALEKDRNRRYPAASELAADVRRYLADSPIQARPPSFWYTARKTLRRHRNVLLPTVLFLVALFAGLGLATYRYVTVRAIALRSGETQRLEAFDAEVESLWPEIPENVRTMEAWLLRAKHETERLPALETELAQLRSKAEAYEVEREASSFLVQRLRDLREERQKLRETASTERRMTLSTEIASLEKRIGTEERYRFASEENQLHHQILSRLVDLLRSIRDVRIPAVESRVRVASSIRDRSIGQEVRWEAARRAIRSSDKYGGLDLPPQLGLLPLGVDPGSGLYEFLHVRSGASPIRDDGERAPFNGVKVGIVLVLIPGATAIIGAETPDVVFEDSADGVTVAAVQNRPFYRRRVGLEAGDVVMAIDGIVPEDAADARSRVSRWTSDQEIRLQIVRAGEPRTIEVRLLTIDPEATSYEGPCHEVAIEPFFISKYEMTQAQWSRFVGENPSNYADDREMIELDNPVERVSWYDAQVQLGRMMLRLPTEAEWEYAARAGSRTPWWTGADEHSLRGAANLRDLTFKRDSNYLGDVIEWLDDGALFHGVVGSWRANPWGLHDVHGNVWEWTATAAHQYDADQPFERDDPYAICRGGSFYSEFASLARSANRIVVTKDYRGWEYGLRPAKSIERP
ncbi:MAG: SUMF1/EgtB/PvdO family nonheme iron enzyme [Planctomycetes bacterium]|nr:SUMF1/EgtB/PvdO family nonheme iron enzyme [Planctomycetota bacterium]